MHPMHANGVDDATLVQVRGQSDNHYNMECVQRFPASVSNRSGPRMMGGFREVTAAVHASLHCGYAGTKPVTFGSTSVAKRRVERSQPACCRQ
jgi:hypothetical protein